MARIKTDRQTSIIRDKDYNHRHIERQAEMQIEGLADREASGHTDRQIERQTDRLTKRLKWKAGRRTERHIEQTVS